MKAEIGIIGGSGLYSMPGFAAQQEATIDDAVRRALGQFRGGRAGRAPGGFSGAPRPRPSPLALGDQLPRQHLRHEIAGRGAHHLAQRGRLAQGRASPARFRPPRSVLRPHARPRLHFLRRGPGGAHQLRRSHLPGAGGRADRAPATPPASPPSRAARISAWKARRFPPRPNRTSIEAGAWT